MMRAIRVHAYGDPSAIRLEEMPCPMVAPDEILVRVQAASVNPVDWKVADGVLRDHLATPFPYTPGGDFAGVVEVVGTAVKSLAPGEAVFGMTSTQLYRAGAFAEFVAVKGADVATMPQRISAEQAAAVPLAALTAWQAVFDRAGLRAGQRILIHAGAGGVGSFAIQFARLAGAEIFATASAANADYLRSLGAHHAIDYRAAPFETGLSGLDVVIDLMGGDIQARSYAVLRRGGVLVNAWGAIMKDKAEQAGARGVKVAVEANGAQLANIAQLIDAGDIRTEIASTMPLADTVAALALSRAGHVRGKIVLRVA